MKYKKCNYDNKKPIGRAINRISKGKYGNIKLNSNGRLMLYHKAVCENEKNEKNT